MKLHSDLKSQSTTSGKVMYDAKNIEPSMSKAKFELTGIIGKSKAWTLSGSGLEQTFGVSLDDDVTVTAVYVSGILLQYIHDYTFTSGKVILHNPVSSTRIITLIVE